MTPRATGLKIPETDRYWCVDLEGSEESAANGKPSGEHHFRLPNFSAGFSLFAWVRARKNADDANTFAKDAQQTLQIGLFVGACWHHRQYSLDAGTYSLRWSFEEADAYAEAVLEELAEAGYSLVQIRQLSIPCLNNLSAWMASTGGVVSAAKDFTPDPQESSTA